MPYADLRKGRYSEPNRLYFVTSVIFPREAAFFKDFHCARLVVNEMRQLHNSEQVNSIAWVIMPDHLHWLLQLSGHSTLAQVMKSLKARSAQKINRHLQRQGSVWQKTYYDHALRRDEAVKDISRYLVANPLRAGLVTSLGDYPLWDAIWL